MEIRFNHISVLRAISLFVFTELTQRACSFTAYGPDRSLSLQYISSTATEHPHAVGWGHRTRPSSFRLPPFTSSLHIYTLNQTLIYCNTICYTIYIARYRTRFAPQKVRCATPWADPRAGGRGGRQRTPIRGWCQGRLLGLRR